MKRITKRQKQLLDMIKKFREQHRYSPTIEELKRELGLRSVATVAEHIEHLCEMGLIKKQKNRSRSIEISSEGFEFLEIKESSVDIPLLGFVSAGEPIEVIEDFELVSVPPEFLGKRRTFALRVKGNSMIEEGIWDGDLVIVEERETADNGETVIALVNGEMATIKRYFREGSRIRLEPANPSLKPLYFKEENVLIKGVVIGVLRRYR